MHLTISKRFLFPVISGSSPRSLGEVLLMCGISRLPATKMGVFTSPHPQVPEPVSQHRLSRVANRETQKSISHAVSGGGQKTKPFPQPGGHAFHYRCHGGAGGGGLAPVPMRAAQYYFFRLACCFGSEIQAGDMRKMILTVTLSPVSDILEFKFLYKEEDTEAWSD